MFGLPYKIVASILVGTAILLAVALVIAFPLNLVM